MAALGRLSGQYETEQQRHSEQVAALQQRVERQAAQSETLRPQVEQLSGHVTCLDADYRTLAATLRGLELMRQPGRQRGPERNQGPSR